MSVVGTATLASGFITGPSSAEPKPTLAEVKEKVQKLEHDAEIAAERSNEKKEQVADLRRHLKKLGSDLDRQQKEVGELRDHIGAYAAAEYRTRGADATVQLLMSKDPQEFLAQMNSARAIETRQGDTIRALQAEKKELAEQRAVQKAQLDRLEDAKKQAATKLDEAKDKYKKAQALLKKLTVEQQERLRDQRTSRGEDRGEDVPPPPTGSGKGAVALNFARAQLGEPYVFGAEGPDSWDCSGLTMMAWAEAGVSLAHSSGTQASQGTPVSRSELAPGDLVIFYSDMHHVGIYAGGGQVIHAPKPGDVVSYIDMDYMPVAKMVRPG